MIKSIIKLMRVKHWIKCGIVFLPLFYSGQIFTDKFWLCIFGFFSFSLMSSCIYIINDIRDVDKDRKDEVKCKRPIASGAVKVPFAIALAVVLFAVSVAMNINNISAMAVIIIYFFVNLGYSMGLKNIPILDVVFLSSGFLFRLVYGSIITDIEISHWLCLTVIACSFYMGLGKRRGELLSSNEEKREVLQKYSVKYLENYMHVFVTLLMVFYALWSTSTGNNYLVWSTILVIIIIMRYGYDIEHNSSGDPVEVLLSDKALIVLVIFYGLLVTGLIYLR